MRFVVAAVQLAACRHVVAARVNRGLDQPLRVLWREQMIDIRHQHHLAGLHALAHAEVARPIPPPGNVLFDAVKLRLDPNIAKVRLGRIARAGIVYHNDAQAVFDILRVGSPSAKMQV